MRELELNMNLRMRKKNEKTICISSPIFALWRISFVLIIMPVFWGLVFSSIWQITVSNYQAALVLFVNGIGFLVVSIFSSKNIYQINVSKDCFELIHPWRHRVMLPTEAKVEFSRELFSSYLGIMDWNGNTYKYYLSGLTKKNSFPKGLVCADDVWAWYLEMKAMRD